MSLTAVSLLLATVAVFGVALILAVALASRPELRPALIPVRARYGRRPRT